MIYSKNSPSPTYLKLLDDYKNIHKKGTANQDPNNTYNGKATILFAETLKKIIKKNNCKTLLDYGSGKGDRYFNESYNSKKIKFPPLKNFWNVEPTLFDPGVPHPMPKEKSFDIVISVDVLEHIPKQDLGWVVDEIFKYAKHVVFVNVACYSALATLSNGDNAHVSVFNPWWWIGFFEAIASKNKVKVFLICTILKNGDRKNPVFITHTINDTIANYK